MRILYIIGNGLDIALNMKTSYQDFFDYYLSVPSSDNDILIMKNNIKSQRYKTWADLEMGLGSYSIMCVNKDIFLKCINDIKKNLREHLIKESQKIEGYTISSIADFISPGNFLEPGPRDIYDAYRHRFSADVSIDIITLNYTQTLELLFNYTNGPLKLSQMANLRTILHVHGTLDRMMVMGVNDSSQISNSSFKTDDDVVEEFVKPEFNEACMNNKNSLCETLINNADIIVLYGSSLGPSDDKWWKEIGKRVGNEIFPLLIYLPYDEKKNLAVQPNHLRRWTKGYVHEIHDKFDVKISEDVLASRVCVGLNKHLFPTIKSVKGPTFNSVVKTK